MYLDLIQAQGISKTPFRSGFADSTPQSSFCMPEAVRFSCPTAESTYLAGQINTDFMPSSNAFQKGVPLVSKSCNVN
jgi:hypothetical protein